MHLNVKRLIIENYFKRPKEFNTKLQDFRLLRKIINKSIRFTTKDWAGAQLEISYAALHEKHSHIILFTKLHFTS